MLAFLAAFQFLTRLPLPMQIPFSPSLVARSTVFFPLIGMILGLILFVIHLLLELLLPSYVEAVLLLLLWIALTGALHLDGLLDSADGLLSHRPREQMLDIMKDSRIGAMGTVTAVLYLMLKATLIFSLLHLPESSTFWLLVLVPLISRWVIVIAVGTYPYARKDSGLGSLYRGVTVQHIVFSTIVCLLSIVAVWYGLSDGQWTNNVITIALMLLFAVFFCVIFSAYCTRRLGGMTGDTYGALNELTELLLLLVILMLGE